MPGKKQESVAAVKKEVVFLLFVARLSVRRHKSPSSRGGDERERSEILLILRIVQTRHAAPADVRPVHVCVSKRETKAGKVCSSFVVSFFPYPARDLCVKLTSLLSAFESMCRTKVRHIHLPSPPLSSFIALPSSKSQSERLSERPTFRQSVTHRLNSHGERVARVCVVWRGASLRDIGARNLRNEMSSTPPALTFLSKYAVSQ